MKHSSGPWFIDGKDICSTEKNEQLSSAYVFNPLVCTMVYEDGFGTQEKNAQLIISSPDMLAVCERAEEYFRNNENVKNMVGPEYGIWHNLRQVIDKARGI